MYEMILSPRLSCERIIILSFLAISLFKFACCLTDVKVAVLILNLRNAQLSSSQILEGPGYPFLIEPEC